MKPLPVAVALLLSACASKKHVGLLAVMESPKSARVRKALTKSAEVSYHDQKAPVSSNLQLPELEVKLSGEVTNQLPGMTEAPGFNVYNGYVCVPARIVPLTVDEAALKLWTAILRINGTSVASEDTIRHMPQFNFDKRTAGPSVNEISIMACSKTKVAKVRTVGLTVLDESKNRLFTFDWSEPWPSLD